METISFDTSISAFRQIVEDLFGECPHIRIEVPAGPIVMLSEKSYENLLLTLEYFSGPGLLNRFRESHLLDTLSWDDACSAFHNSSQSLSEERQQIKIETPEGPVIILSEETHQHLLVTLEFFSGSGVIEKLQEAFAG